MGHRLSKIVTKTGDARNHRPRRRLARAEGFAADRRAGRRRRAQFDARRAARPSDCRCTIVGELIAIQHDLFDCGGEMAIPGYVAVTEAQVARLEQQVEAHNEQLEPLKEFILPGGERSAALAHLARTVCRRAERVGRRAGGACTRRPAGRDQPADAQIPEPAVRLPFRPRTGAQPRCRSRRRAVAERKEPLTRLRRRGEVAVRGVTGRARACREPARPEPRASCSRQLLDVRGETRRAVALLLHDRRGRAIDEARIGRASPRSSYARPRAAAFLRQPLALGSDVDRYLEHQLECARRCAPARPTSAAHRPRALRSSAPAPRYSGASARRTAGGRPRRSAARAPSATATSRSAASGCRRRSPSPARCRHRRPRRCATGRPSGYGCRLMLASVSPRSCPRAARPSATALR